MKLSWQAVAENAAARMFVRQAEGYKVVDDAPGASGI